jgi:hypothetical protein
VSPVMVVGVEPGVKGGAAFGFGGVGAGVGPFAGEGAVVAPGFAVRPCLAGRWGTGPGTNQGTKVSRPPATDQVIAKSDFAGP